MRALAMLSLLAACSTSGSEPLDASPGDDRPGAKLDVSMPGVSADGYIVYEVAELQNDPRANDPSYIYLDYGVDAVRLPGPTFPVAESDTSGVYVVANANVSTYLWGPEAYQDGLRVSINDRLHFDMKIEDFENETTPLAIVEMTYFEGNVKTSFIMLGNGTDGIAHRIETRAYVDDAAVGTMSGPHTIELRGHPY